MPALRPLVSTSQTAANQQLIAGAVRLMAIVMLVFGASDVGRTISFELHYGGLAAAYDPASPIDWFFTAVVAVFENGSWTTLFAPLAGVYFLCRANLWARRLVKPSPNPPCPKCGYLLDLTNPLTNCPECGLQIFEHQPAVPTSSPESKDGPDRQ